MIRIEDEPFFHDRAQYEHFEVNLYKIPCTRCDLALRTCSLSINMDALKQGHRRLNG